MSKIYEHLRGYWSPARPTHAGVYLVRRSADDSPWVMHWNAEPASCRREFFHLDGDAQDAPTRWDQPRVVELAMAAGWLDASRGRRRRG